MDHKQPVTLSSGGFTADTEIMTTAGPVLIDDLTTDHRVYALDLPTGVMRRKRVTDIDRFEFDEQVVEIRTNRANLRVAPDHRIPYTTEDIAWPRIQRAGDLWDRYEYKFINNWERPPRQQLETVDLTDLLAAFDYEYELCAVFDEHGHTVRSMLPEGCEPIQRYRELGYAFDPKTFKQYQESIEESATTVKIRSGKGFRARPYRFDMNDFIELIGWFVTEGSVYWKNTRDTATLQIAQKTEEYRESIKALFERMQIPVQITDNGFRVGSKLYGQLFESLCGSESRNKRLPAFVWDLSTDQQAMLLTALLRGDGNKRGTYYTSSEGLARDVLRLCLEQNMNPHYDRRGSSWRVYARTKQDGFLRPRNLQWIDDEQPLYRLTVEDYSTVMAGRNYKFQWVGASQIR